MGTVYYYFRTWSKNGKWEAINGRLRAQEREKRGCQANPTGAIIDSQSVKTTEATTAANGLTAVNVMLL